MEAGGKWYKHGMFFESKQPKKLEEVPKKLDGVGPVDNRPSID